VWVILSVSPVRRQGREELLLESIGYIYAPADIAQR